MKREETLNKLINDTASMLGYSIYETTVMLRGKRPRITVKIDHRNGISHNDCERYSRELTHRIDHAGIFDDYILEVSSPGITRELRSIDDFVRFKGSPVKGVFNDAGLTKTFKGIVHDVTEDSITIRENNKDITIIYTQIIKANLDY